MRILTLRLSTQDGKLSSEASLVIDDKEDIQRFLANLASALEIVEHKLDVLERDGPWKPGHVDAPPFPEEAYKRHVEQSKK